MCKQLARFVILWVIAFAGANVWAQEFKIDNEKVVSVSQKESEPSEENSEYVSEVCIKGKAGASQSLDKIYFISESGKVDDVFGLDLDADGVSEIILISSDQVPSDPIEGNVGAYINVSVYKLKNQKYEKNEKLTNIFSGGIDKAVDPAAEKLVYKFVYPYKTKKDVEQFSSAQVFKSFVSSGSADYVMQAKTTIYPEPFVFESKMYLIANDKIKITEISGGWVTFFYVSAKKGQIQASAKLADLKL